jgi:hypothetical protein
LGNVVKRYSMKDGDVFDIQLIPDSKNNRSPEQIVEPNSEPSPNPTPFIPILPLLNPISPRPVPIPLPMQRVIPNMPILLFPTDDPNILERLIFPDNWRNKSRLEG